MNLSNRAQTAIACVLVLLMALTRGHHFADLHHLPGASWAVFFLAGVYLRPVWTLPLFLGQAFLMDFAALTWGGSSAGCFTAAYTMLVPAYASLWLAGRWYARHHRFAVTTLLTLGAALLAGTLACELFSSGGYYLFSGRFEPTLGEFAGRVAQYYPAYLGSAAFYVGLGAMVHGAIGIARGARGQHLAAN